MVTEADYDSTSDESSEAESTSSRSDESDEEMAEAASRPSSEEEETKDERRGRERDIVASRTSEGSAEARQGRYPLRSRTTSGAGGALSQTSAARHRQTVADTRYEARQRISQERRAYVPTRNSGGGPGRWASTEQDDYDTIPDLVSCSSSSDGDAD